MPDANCARMQQAPTGLFDDPASSGALECDFSEYRLQNVPFSAFSWADFFFADCGRTLILQQAFPLGILDTLDMPAAESVGGEELKSRLKTSLAAATELPRPMRPAIFGLDQASNSVLPTTPKAADNQQNQGCVAGKALGGFPLCITQPLRFMQTLQRSAGMSAGACKPLEWVKSRLANARDAFVNNSSCFLFMLEALQKTAPSRSLLDSCGVDG